LTEEDNRIARRRAEVEREIVDVLCTCRSLRGEATRQLLVDRIVRRTGVSLSVPAAATDAAWFLGLVVACQDLLGGVVELVPAARDLRVEHPTLDALARLADRWEAYGLLDDVPDEVLRPLEAEMRRLAPADLAGAYRHVAGDGARALPAHCDTAWAALLWLICQNAPPPRVAPPRPAPVGPRADRDPSLPPSMAFLEAVKDVLTPGTAGQVDIWNRRRAREEGVVRQLDEARLLRDPRTREPGVVHLIMQFEVLPGTGNVAERPAARARAVEVTCWRQWPRSAHFERVEKRVCTVGELPGVTRVAVVELEQELEDTEDSIMIEFILSQELFHLKVEEWPMEEDRRLPSAIGIDYPLALRSLERQRMKSWHRRWHRRWRQLAESYEHGVRFGFDDEGGDELSGLHAAITDDEKTVAVVLSGSPERRGSRYGRELAVALRCGVPIIMWHRGEPTQTVSTALRAFLDGTDDDPSERADSGRPVGVPGDPDGWLDFAGGVGTHVTGGRLHDLRGRAQRLRARAYKFHTGTEDLGRRLALIWDDPERQPERGR
jgi:hypothetical protein